MAEITLYEAVGGMPFFEALVGAFYDGVAADPEFLAIYPTPDDLGPARRRLTLFLAQYWGGPTTYSENRGHPRLRMGPARFRGPRPPAHHRRTHFRPPLAQHWLTHFRAALDEVGLTPEQDAQFWDYVTHAAQFMVNTPEA